MPLQELNALAIHTLTSRIEDPGRLLIFGKKYCETSLLQHVIYQNLNQNYCGSYNSACQFLLCWNSFKMDASASVITNVNHYNLGFAVEIKDMQSKICLLFKIVGITYCGSPVIQHVVYYQAKKILLRVFYFSRSIIE